MPYVEHSSYVPRLFCLNPHVQTVWHSECRRVHGVRYQRERVETKDGDFLDFDWMRSGRKKLALIMHGLESTSARPYMKGMVKALWERGFDCLAMNLRGCGGEINRLKTFYHAGKSDDVDAALAYALDSGYNEIFLVGFSLGGNMVLRWLGEKGPDLCPQVKAAAAVSAPCDLVSSNVALNRPSNRFYNRRFVRKLVTKVRAKACKMPGIWDMELLDSVRNLEEFDALITAPDFGFDGVEDYYRKASASPLLGQIRVPTLLLNALDDPFLGPDCFPVAKARENPAFYLETPTHGGHVGFLGRSVGGEYWHEGRVAAFFLDENRGCNAFQGAVTD